MEAYLDNAATTKVSESVKDIMVKTLIEDYGNPSSLHIKGLDAERYIRNAKKILAKRLKVEEKEIIFTSGGTESNNLAIIGSAFANKRAGNHIITSNTEHPSVYNAMGFLQEQGFRISYTPVDQYGKIDIEELKKMIDKDTILVSIMYVNNEIGSVNDISQVSKAIKEKNPNTLFHVDGIQAIGKYEIFPQRQGIDLMSISGHKIHGPKGIGALYIRDRVKISPLLFGGGQENKMRSGTENVPGIAGLGQAISDIYENHTEKIEALYRLKEEFVNGINKLNTTIGDV
ncbi:MAG: cysteine desulfurase, partial [Clostridiales bacterium]|nr:cysteine desulfurase [Clostridiales bacterium]